MELEQRECRKNRMSTTAHLTNPSSTFRKLRRAKSKSPLTFAAGDGSVPHHVSILDDTGDGFRSVGLDEALVACEEH